MPQASKPWRIAASLIHFDLRERRSSFCMNGGY
jgi:hypothetical protein